MHRTNVGSTWAWQAIFQLYCSKLKKTGHMKAYVCVCMHACVYVCSAHWHSKSIAGLSTERDNREILATQFDMLQMANNQIYYL